jgi:tRNA pseudouridine38-40 synthase
VNKLYRYRILNSRRRSPFELNKAWHINTILDLEAMSSISHMLLGKKDFSSFRASGCVARFPVRTISRCDIACDGDIISFEIEADGFLRHMVRNIVGTLADVGRHRFSTDDFSAILEARERTRAGRAAPPHGLYLVRVDYPC